jgi:hypothetical protein
MIPMTVLLCFVRATMRFNVSIGIFDFLPAGFEQPDSQG